MTKPEPSNSGLNTIKASFDNFTLDDLDDLKSAIEAKMQEKAVAEINAREEELYRLKKMAGMKARQPSGATPGPKKNQRRARKMPEAAPVGAAPASA